MGNKLFNAINDRRVRTIIVVLFVCLFIFGVYRLSSFLVSKSVSSGKVVENVEKDKYRNKQSSPDAESLDSDFIVYEDPEKDYSRVKVLFSNSDLEDRQKNFLGNNYDAYKSALKSVKDNYVETFKSIKDVPEDINYSGYIDYNKSDINLFDRNFSSTNDIVYIRDRLSIIGMYGSYCIVYALDYGMTSDVRLIVVDYSNAELSTKSAGLFGFGQSKNVMIFSKYSKLEEGNGYKILYIKEI